MPNPLFGQPPKAAHNEPPQSTHHRWRRSRYCADPDHHFSERRAYQNSWPTTKPPSRRSKMRSTLNGPQRRFIKSFR